ncbi:MAG: AMP-binding protein, partial [Pseudolabrys sp.]
MTRTSPDRTPAARLVDALARDFAPADRTVPAMLARQAKRFGGKILVSSGGQSWTYAQARDEAARFGATLRAAGIKCGDRVALICSNRLDFLRAFLGCAWIGAVSVPINTASRGHQLQHILSNSAARLLIVEGAFAGNLDHLDVAALPLETIWTIDAEAPLRVGTIMSARVPASGQACEAEATRPRDMLTILYTSGTTGPSKGVCCPHAQYFWWGANTAALLGLSGNDVLQSTLPLFHTNALNTFFQALLMGVSVTYEKRFSASDFYAALTRSNATATYVLGAMVPILLSRPRGPEERAHRVTVALAPGVP